MKINQTELYILSYIKKYKTVSVTELQSLLNITEQGIADCFVDLYKEGYLHKDDNDIHSFELTKKIDVKSIPDWDELSDISFLGFSLPELTDPYNTGGLNIKSVRQLDSVLRMKEINLNYQYHTFQIKNGIKIRTINAPSIKLKERQRWILRYILSNYSLPPYVHGYVKGKSIKTNAEQHIGQKEILCLDLKDFFPSIGFNQVIDVFERLGYSYAISRRLAQICTYRKVLPQGGVTSPMISNIVAMKMDSELNDLAMRKGCVYTRYADDVTFSWKSTDIEKYLLEDIKKIIKANGFCVNDKKTHVMKSPYRKIVTGLIVTDTCVRIPAKIKRELKKEIYYCQKYGVTSHLQYTGREHVINFMEYLYGKAYFIKMVEPDVGEQYLKQIDCIFQTYS